MRCHAAIEIGPEIDNAIAKTVAAFVLAWIFNLSNHGN